MTASIGRLAQAAEQTIAAAAAALLWAGEDSHGVLAHVAAADPWLMAGTRLVYERLAAETTLRDVVVRLGEEYRTTTTTIEVAALPWLVSPGWTSRVSAALIHAPYDSGARAAQSMVHSALLACRQWSEDPLNLDRIKYWAWDVERCADWCWHAERR
jgi:hypothetical protein